MKIIILCSFFNENHYKIKQNHHGQLGSARPPPTLRSRRRRSQPASQPSRQPASQPINQPPSKLANQTLTPKCSYTPGATYYVRLLRLYDEIMKAEGPIRKQKKLGHLAKQFSDHPANQPSSKWSAIALYGPSSKTRQERLTTSVC